MQVTSVHLRVDSACTAIHIEYMRKDAAITLRIPSSLKRRLEGAARKARRSLSAEIAYRLEMTVESESDRTRPQRPMMGRFAGTRVPTERDFAEVRRMLWGALPRRMGRAHS
jgi:predicted transcriptional regulator